MEKMSLKEFLDINELEISCIEIESDQNLGYIILDSGEVIEILEEIK